MPLSGTCVILSVIGPLGGNAFMIHPPSADFLPYPAEWRGGGLGMPSELELVVRSTEIDVNGHVNNAKYLEYLEWGREDWYERAGLDYAAFLEMGIQTVTVNVNINYRRECVQGEKLVVRTSALRIGRTSYALRQELLDAGGAARADAEVTSVCLDAAERRSRELPERLRAALAADGAATA